MGKNPAFQFYPSDWTRDMDDQDLEIEGAWIRIICRLWWSETRGEATKPLKEWARILRKTEQKTSKIFQILFEKRIASGSVLDNQNVTIISRRMVADYKLSELRKQVGCLGGNPKLLKTKTNLDNQTANQKPTPSTSSSSSTTKNSNKGIFQIPSLQEVSDYCLKRKNKINPEVFIAHYNSNGWMVGKNKMKDWKSAIITWENREKNNGTEKFGTNTYRKNNNDRKLDPSTEEACDRIAAEYYENKAKANSQDTKKAV